MTIAGSISVPWSWLANGTTRVDAHINRARAEAGHYPDHIIKLIDDQGRILYASDSHEPILGFSAEALLGVHFHDVIAREDIIHSELSIQDALMNEEATEIGFRHLRADGTFVYLRRKTCPLQGDRHSAYYILTRARPRD
ncbi:MAG: fold [Candidatus Saccharibacteria bacterium]|jgi:PAS domain S-box-containing protein|nr:fold [Candidatus Saccharibacteria bacterium]